MEAKLRSTVFFLDKLHRQRAHASSLATALEKRKDQSAEKREKLVVVSNIFTSVFDLLQGVGVFGNGVLRLCKVDGCGVKEDVDAHRMVSLKGEILNPEILDVLSIAEKRLAPFDAQAQSGVHPFNIKTPVGKPYDFFHVRGLKRDSKEDERAQWERDYGTDPGVLGAKGKTSILNNTQLLQEIQALQTGYESVLPDHLAKTDFKGENKAVLSANLAMMRKFLHGKGHRKAPAKPGVALRERKATAFPQEVEGAGLVAMQHALKRRYVEPAQAADA